MAKKKTQAAKPVIKPFLRGSWHGKDAVGKGLKLILSILFISFLYLILGLLFSFDSFILRVISSSVLIILAAMYMYFQGANAGEADTAFSEIMYQHEQDGKAVVALDRDHCFHPGKGFFEIGVALIPYLLVTLVFAMLAQLIVYTLGVLPSWLDLPAQQTHVSEALAYYSIQDTPISMSIYRMIVRAMTMPFINIALPLGSQAVLWAERLTPLWVAVTPLAYGFGYLQGPNIRIKINTGISIGIRNKRRKERKARKARVASKTPERLI